MTQQSVLRVGLVDDHKMLLDFMAQALNDLEDFDVSVIAESVAEVNKWVDPRNLDVMVIDIELPDGSGIALGKTLRKSNPALGIVLLSARNDAEPFLAIPEGERMGWSYLTKSSTKSIGVLAGAVKATAHGDVVLDPLLVERYHARPGSSVSRLSKRQFEILRLVSRGETNVGISEQLGITSSSVGNHLIQIYNVLGISETQNQRVSAAMEFASGTIPSRVQV